MEQRRILFDARPLLETGGATAVATAAGGVSRVAGRVLQHVRETQLEAEVVLITTGTIKPDLASYGLRHIHLTLPNKLWSLLCFLKLTSLDRAASMVAKQSFDELILPNIGFVGHPHIPTTIVVHDLSFLIEPRWFPWHMRWWHEAVDARCLIEHADHIWCVSQTTANDVIRLLGVSPERINVLEKQMVIGNHHPPSPGRTACAPTPYVLAFDGNPRKNISTAITVVERLRDDKRFHDLKLIIVGNSQSVIRNSQSPWIVIKSHISDDKLGDLYRHASALLYPSWYEGFGLPLHEAAQFGIPLLASTHGALPETAPPGSIFINPAKPHLWTIALKQALSGNKP